MLFLGTAMIVPLFLVDGPSVARLNFMLMAPPPPPPPPAAMKLVQVPPGLMRATSSGPRLFTYTRIPPTVPQIDDAGLLPPMDAPLYRGGVPGGTGLPDGVPGGIHLGQTWNVPPPVVAEAVKPAKPVAPVREQPVTRIKVGTGVQAAKLIHRVVPPYPPLAKAARIQGTVRLMGILSTEGRIIQLQVLSGHPLLVNASLDAVRQWVYQPTLLNGEPVEVIAPIDVHFTLNN